MNLKELVAEKLGGNNINKKVFTVLTTIVVILGLFLVCAILFPTAVATILNVIWIILIAIVIVFLVLGILVILGMRKEVSRILDIFLEGSLSIIDFLHFLKSVWRRFVELLKEFLLYAAPVFAYIVAFILYVLIMILYKKIGSNNDVTLLTVLLTFALIIAFGVVNKPVTIVREVTTWKNFFGDRFKAGFVDGCEVILFVFFLTMDSTNLFFLPKDLNIPLHASFGDFDLMIKSFVYSNHFKFTFNLIVASISIEILRNIMRVYVMAQIYYKQLVEENMLQAEKVRLLTLVKLATRKSFNDAKDDLMRFITFTTILFIAFLFFPRLKLVTLVVASIGNLALDIFIRPRLTSRKGTDLISKTLEFFFFRTKEVKTPAIVTTS